MIPRAISRALGALPDARPVFPGATLVVDGTGEIQAAWHGPASPIDAVNGDVFAALGLTESSTEAARVQLVLAAAIGAIAPAWNVLAYDAPTLVARGELPPLALQWQPVVDGGVIVGIAVFAHAIPMTAALEPDDPSERDRLCIDALGLLDECDGSLMHLRSFPEARHSVHRMFRAVHTIKGSTRGTRLRSVSTIAHQLEETLDTLRRSDTAQQPHLLEIVAVELRRLRAEIQAARPRSEGDDAMTELSGEVRPALAELRISLEYFRSGDTSAVPAAMEVVDKIAAAAERARMRALGLQALAARNALQMIDAPLTGTSVDELLAEVEALEPQIELYRDVYREFSASDTGPSILATLSSWLDAAADDAAGLEHLARALTEAGVPSFAATLAESDPYALRRALAVLTDAPAMFELARPRDDGRLRLERAQRELLDLFDRLTGHATHGLLTDARRIVQQLVWTPLSGHGRTISRMIRRVASELGKQVQLEVDFGDLMAAPEISRVIGEILVHAVRNAADHGIEAPGERVAVGKDPTGKIVVHGFERDGRLVVVVTDDGNGIALERVRELGVARRLVKPDAAERLTPSELIELLFTPGFTTVSAVSAISGRGVGMDVIRCLAREHGGEASLTTQPGMGTELTLELPFMAR